jgi:hypothetical protein
LLLRIFNICNPYYTIFEKGEQIIIFRKQTGPAECGKMEKILHKRKKSDKNRQSIVVNPGKK